MIKKTFLEFEKVTHCSISVIWEIDPQISPTSIVLRLKKHSTPPEDLGSVKLSGKAIGYDLLSLSPNTLYEIQVAPCNNSRQFSWSNLIVCKTLPTPVYDLFYKSEKVVHRAIPDSKEIIDARGLKGWNEYVSCGYKFARPKELRSEILKRIIARAEAISLLEDDFNLEDSYFQGPFVMRTKS